MVFQSIVDFLKSIKNALFNSSFIRFCLFGIINTLNTSIFSSLFGLFLQDNIAGIFGYILSLQGAYLLTCRFIFRSKSTLKKYNRFLISYIPSFLVYILIHAGALGALKLSQFWASFLAVMLSGPLTFIIVKIYAFNETANKRDKYE